MDLTTQVQILDKTVCFSLHKSLLEAIIVYKWLLVTWNYIIAWKK